MVAGLGLMGAYISLIIIGVVSSLLPRCRNQFGRLVAMGVTVNFSLFVQLINMGMVMGVIPGGWRALTLGILWGEAGDG